MFSEMVPPSHHPPGFPRHISSRIAHAGPQPVTGKEKGLPLAPQWGWGQRVLARGGPLKKIEVGKRMRGVHLLPGSPGLSLCGLKTRPSHPFMPGV